MRQCKKTVYEDLSRGLKQWYVIAGPFALKKGQEDY